MTTTNWAIVAAAVLILGGVLYFALAGPTSTPTTTIPANATPTTTPTNSGENPPAGTGGVHNQPVEPAAAAARKALAARLGIAESSIVIMEVEERQWSDGCLGLGGPAESCIAALTEGFKVDMEARGESYTYRTDKTGAAVRAETQ